MTYRSRLCRAAVILLLSSCSASREPDLPDVAPGCPAAQQENEKDGGIGGTGRAPGQCGEETPAE